VNQPSSSSSKKSLDEKVDDFTEEVEDAIIESNDDPDRVSNVIMYIYSMRIDQNKDFN
jgi:hypothetical protein